MTPNNVFRGSKGRSGGSPSPSPTVFGGERGAGSSSPSTLGPGVAGGLSAPPWARVREVQLIRREVRESLSPGAVEVLFEHAELVVEGGEEVGGRRAIDRRVFATVMVTIDLACCAARFREPADEATARRVAELMEEDLQVRHQLCSLAARELARLSGCEAQALAVSLETTMRVEGTAVLVDVDAMATLSGRRG